MNDIPDSPKPEAAPRPVASAQQRASVSDGNDEFPIPFERYANSLAGTHDAVYAGHLRIMHGRENHKMGEWSALLDSYKNAPAHPEHPDYAE